MDKKKLRRYKEALRTEILRCYRVIEYLDFSQMAGSLPAEVIEGYVLNDLETYEYFAVFRFQSTSQIPIKELGIKLYLFSNSAVTYSRIDAKYPAGDIGFGLQEYMDEKTKEVIPKKVPGEVINYGEIFGSYVLIPLPNRYFTRMRVEFKYTVFENGERKEYDFMYGKNRPKSFRTYDEDTIFAFNHLNIYMKQEEEHPTTVIPQQGEVMWLCCCGHKNLNSTDFCTKCSRNKTWQLENLSEKALEKVTDSMKQEAEVSYTRMKRSKYERTELEEDPEERMRRIEEYQKVLENVAKQQAEQSRKKWMIFPKIIAYFAIFNLIIYLLGLLVR
jgi:hypothetical protein